MGRLVHKVDTEGDDTEEDDEDIIWNKGRLVHVAEVQVADREFTCVDTSKGETEHVDTAVLAVVKACVYRDESDDG